MSVTYTPHLDDDKTSYPYSPLTHMLRVYCNFVQTLFSSPNEFGLRYMHDSEQTDIDIRLANSVNAEVLERKPAVLIHRTAFSFPQQSIGGDMSTKDIKTGKVVREAMAHGGAYFTVIASPDHYADDIAWYIVECMWLLKSLEGGDLYFTSGNFSISPPSVATGLVEGDNIPSVYAVQVSFPARLKRRSSVSPLTEHRLKEIQLALRDSATQATLLDINLSLRGTEE